MKTWVNALLKGKKSRRQVEKLLEKKGYVPIYEDKNTGIYANKERKEMVYIDWVKREVWLPDRKVGKLNLEEELEVM